MVCARPAAAGAQGHVVNTTSDHAPDGCDDGPPGDCTLREAVRQYTATEIELPHDTYPLTSQLSYSARRRRSASSIALISDASRRPAVLPNRCGSTTVVCSTRTRVSIPSTSMLGLN